MTEITLNTDNLSNDDIQAALDAAGAYSWSKPEYVMASRNYESFAIKNLAAALRLIRKERADYNALMAAYEELQDTNASILSETMEFKRKVSDAMKAVQGFITATIDYPKPAHDITHCGVNVTFSDFILPDPVDPARELWGRAMAAFQSSEDAAIAVIADAMRGDGK